MYSGSHHHHCGRKHKSAGGLKHQSGLFIGFQVEQGALKSLTCRHGLNLPALDVSCQCQQPGHTEMEQGGDGATSYWTGLLILPRMIRLFLSRSSWRHQVSELLTGRQMTKLISFIRKKTSFFSVYGHRRQSGVAASHADSVLGPCGCRETACPAFSFCFLPLSSGRRSL